MKKQLDKLKDYINWQKNMDTTNKALKLQIA
jgi:hypothetical protein